MTDKKLLLQDLCARLPYGVIIQVKDWTYLDTELKIGHISRLKNDDIELKPYLRSLSSMNEKEKEKFINLRRKIELGVNIDLSIYNYLNFLYSCHIDVNDRLLNKKLAIEAPEGMYNVK